jgi:uncharacterized membrane-anchored protein
MKGVNGAGIAIDTEVATAVFVPIAVLSIWWVVRRVRRRHIDAESD